MEHPLLEKATEVVAQNYPEVTGDMFALLVANELFNQLRALTCSGPLKPFSMLLHAQKVISDMIAAEWAEQQYPNK